MSDQLDRIKAATLRQAITRCSSVMSFARGGSDIALIVVENFFEELKAKEGR